MKKNKIYFLFMLIVFLENIFPEILHSQTEFRLLEEWEIECGSYNEFFDNALTITNSADEVFIASSVLNSYTGYFDLLISKFTARGELVWSDQINIDSTGNMVNGALELDFEGNIIITGSGHKENNGYDLFVVKYSSSGILQWVYTYNTLQGLDDSGSAITVDSSNNIYVTGVLSQSIQDVDFVTIKFKPNGDQEWVKTYDGDGFIDVPARIQFDSFGNIVVAGAVQKGFSNWAISFITYSTSGNLIFESELVDSAFTTIDQIKDITRGNNGDFYITGIVENPYSGADILVVKVNNSLIKEWDFIYNHTITSEDVPNAIDVDYDGNVYIAGYSQDISKEILAIKLNPQGVLQWGKTFGKEQGGGNVANDLIVDSDNDFIWITGYSEENGKKDFNTIYVDQSGEIKYRANYNSKYNKDDVAFSIIQDEDSNIIVTGKTSINDKLVYTTIKYRKSDLVRPEKTLSDSKSIEFIPNMGQLVDSDQRPIPEVEFYQRSLSPDLYFFDSKFSMVLAEYSDFSLDSIGEIITHRVDFSFIGAENPIIASLENRTDYRNYYDGHIPEGRERVPIYTRLIHHSIYSSIDLEYSSNIQGIKYFFIVKPGGDPRDIKILVEGHDSLNVTIDGNLKISTSIEDILLFKPRAYLINSSGDTTNINSWSPSFFVVDSTFSIITGAYDQEQSLIIVIENLTSLGDCESPSDGLEYSTYYGGTGIERALGITGGVNELGFAPIAQQGVFIAGYTYSADFPVLGGPVTALQGSSDAFVIKMNSFQRVWVTHFGGNVTYNGGSCATTGNEIVYNITDKVIYFIGKTNCFDFPITFEDEYPIDDFIGDPITNNDVSKAFLTKLNLDGFKLYSTYYGGPTGLGGGTNVFVNSEGSIYICGVSESTPELESENGNFYQDSNGDGDGFVAEFDKDCRLIWATQFSGPGAIVRSLAINKNGDLLIVGDVAESGAPSTDFFNQPGIQDYFSTTVEGDRESFIAKFAIGQNTRDLIWSTLFAGDNYDAGTNVAINSENDIVFQGLTRSNASTFPIEGNYLDNENNECNDLFISQFSENGILEYSSLFGGNDNEGFTGTAGCLIYLGPYTRSDVFIGKNDNVYVGYNSQSEDLSLQPYPGVYFQDAMGNNGPQSDLGDPAILVLSKDMEKKLSTYFGGWSEPYEEFWLMDVAEGVEVVGNKMYLIGFADGVCPRKHPVLDNIDANYFQSERSGDYDAFISVFSLDDLVGTKGSLEDILDAKLTVFPNPSDQFIILEIAEDDIKNGKVKISNIVGENLFHYDLSEQFVDQLKISTTGFPNGYYVLLYSINGYSYPVKFVVQH